MSVFIKLLDPIGSYPAGSVVKTVEEDGRLFVQYAERNSETLKYERFLRDVSTITHEVVKYTINDILEMCNDKIEKEEAAWSDVLSGLIQELGFDSFDADRITYNSDNVERINLMFTIKYAQECTDTYVGFGIMYFDGKPLSSHNQPGRKYDVAHYLITTSVALEAQKFIQSMLQELEPIEGLGLNYDITDCLYNRI